MRHFAFVVVVLFLASITEYIIGRILLPEMGLTAPRYAVWFWVTLVYAVMYFVYGMIKEAIE